MNTELGMCEVCEVEPAACVMYPISTTDEERSNGPVVRSKNMCIDCAFEAFASGEYESDDN